MVVLLAIDPSTRELGWAVFSSEPLRRDSEPTTLEEMSKFSSNGHQNNGIHPHPAWNLDETGIIIAHDRPRRVEVSERIKAIENELARMAEVYQFEEVACGKPSQLQLPYQREGVEMLDRTLYEWAQSCNLPLYSYSLREIRAAIVGRGNGGKEELAYAVMTRWGLLGEGKNTHEWNAVAVGDYHLGQRKAVKVG